MRDQAEDLSQTTLLLYRAAIGLTARHFPLDESDGSILVSSRDVSFLLDGHLDVWIRWRDLPHWQACQIAALIRLRRNEYADAEVIKNDLRVHVGAGSIPGCSLKEETETEIVISCTPGMPLDTFIDTTLTELESLSSIGRGHTPIAKPGTYVTTLRVVSGGTVERVVDARYTIPSHAVLEQASAVAATVPTAPSTDQVTVPAAELLDLATRLDHLRDTDSGGGFRARYVRKLCERLRCSDGVVGVDGLIGLESGDVRVLNAPTGSGKSVLMEVFACWAALHDIVVTLVVPTNSDCLKLVRAIETDLAALGSTQTVTPLMSPSSVHAVLQSVLRTRPWWDPTGEWTYARLGYGCALTRAALTDAAVDAWQPGNEPCTSLQLLRSDGTTGKRRACPWRMTCGKFGLARAAMSASVIVTSHTNFHTGRVHIPVHDDRGVTNRMSVEELVLRRSQVIVIDEIDAFQADVLGDSARGLLLNTFSRSASPLQQLDIEFSDAASRVRTEVDATVRELVLYARFLAETYVSALARRRIGPLPDRRSQRGPGRRWIVARRWDGYLTARLLQLAEEDPLTPEAVASFRSLFPDEDQPHDSEPAYFRPLRQILTDVTGMGRGPAVIETSREQLDSLLAGVVEDSERAHVVELLLRRAILERLRQQLRRFVFQAPHLGAAGVQSAQEIVETFGPYSRWRATPNGPLGRLLFAFTESYDAQDPRKTQLRAAAFGGDPHVYVTGLGDITALCRAGVRRAVLGLSATSYFPRAPHHHVHIDPHWWVPDDDPDGVTILGAPITAERSPLRVSGKQDTARTSALRKLGKLLWDRRIRSELDHLAVEDPDRARVLLATTSYAGGQALAEGLLAAGVDPGRICLAIRPQQALGPTNGVMSTDVFDESGWHELTADRLEDFPKIEGAQILIAPLARVQRGVNIIGTQDRSAIGSIWLVVRPVPLIDEPAELIAHVNAHVLADDPADRIAARVVRRSPADILQIRRNQAGAYFEEIVRSKPYFRSLPKGVRLSITAEIMNGIIQLVGRARRGGTPATIHLVDGAFLDPEAGPTFASLIQQLRDHWADCGVLERLRELYGPTLEAFFTYADIQNALFDQ